jgi:hypothetical protein
MGTSQDQKWFECGKDDFGEVEADRKWFRGPDY